MSNMREASKTNWTSRNTLEEINAGSLQRIADATEKMSANWANLTEERDRYKRWYDEQRKTGNRLANSNKALRGYINRMKRLSKGTK